MTPKFLRALASLFLGCSATTALAQSNPYQSAMDSLFNGFKTKNYDLVKPLLDDKMTIGTLPVGMNDMVMAQLIKQLPPPISYVITGTKAEAGGTRVSTTVTYDGGTTLNQSFLFNANRKISDLNLLGDAGQVMTAAVASPEILPDQFVVPFEIHNRIIFVKAMLNGKEEDFILDSGAPVLVLNSDGLSETDTVHSSPIQAQGIGGTVATGVAHVRSFNWQGVIMNNFDGITMSLKHLEKDARHHFAGIIGYTVFQDYEITFDYKNKTVSFIRVDDDGEPVIKVPASTANVCIIPFEMNAHIPVFTMTAAGKTYRMGLDCGAGSNLLFAKYLAEQEDNTSRLRKAHLGGAGTDQVKAGYGKIRLATVGTVSYKNMHFAFDDGNLSQLNDGYGLNIDGLLGYEFLKQNKTTVNYKKNQLRIYPE